MNAEHHAAFGRAQEALGHARTRGGGPKFCKFGKAVRYAMTDLEAFIEASAQINTSKIAARQLSCGAD